ncbi:MAG: nucleotidyltransferase domain-containing protein [Nitrospirae bacterium]|nr:nucleotidyltransferase domain-containing protein [Nitrospirota bacterium]
MDKRSKKDIVQLAQRYGIKLIVLFGSMAVGIHDKESDIDIGVYGDKLLTEIDLVNISTELSRIFNNNRVDIVDIKRAPALLKKEIFKNFKVLFEVDPKIKYQLELYAEAEFEELSSLYEIKRTQLVEFVND